MDDEGWVRGDNFAKFSRDFDHAGRDHGRLPMMTNFLSLWETYDFVGALDAPTG